MLWMPTMFRRRTQNGFHTTKAASLGAGMVTTSTLYFGKIMATQSKVRRWRNTHRYHGIISGGKSQMNQIFFKPSCTWTFISSTSFGVRKSLGGAIFDVGGSSAFPSDDLINVVTGYLCSKVAFEFLKISAPTLNFQAANLNALPWTPLEDKTQTENLVEALINLSKSDWDSYETSWDFTTLPMLSVEYRAETQGPLILICAPTGRV